MKEPPEAAGPGGAAGPAGLGDLDAVVGPLVKQAGELALRWFRAPVATDDKGGPGGYDPVTDADRAAEAYLRAELAARYPDARIVGEEGGESGGDGPLQWVIDPIDGTKSFVSGVPLWGVLLGLLVDGRPAAGWCRLPYLDETYAAAGGAGWAELRGERRPLRTRRTRRLADATMYSTHPSMFEGRSRADFERLAGRVRLQRFGGDCYSYCLLALGHIDLVVEAQLQPYDILPLVPVVEAAGGQVAGAASAGPAPAGPAPAGPGETPGFVVAAATADLCQQAIDVLAGTFAGSPEREQRRRS